MKRKILLIPAIAIYLNVSAQTGINTRTVNVNSVLEVFSTNKGTLLPRIALVATDNISPLTAHVAGMLVYNTATSGVNPNQVIPGYYYNNGIQWIRLLDKVQPNSPWFNVANNLPATANTENIYHNGKVGIFTVNPTNALHINPTTPGTDPIKIEGLQEATGIENQLYANAAGVIHISTQPPHFFHAS